MPEVRTLRFAELSPGDLACWDAWQRADSTLDSPCFRPEFLAVADQVMGPVEVAVIHEQGEPLAFLPYQRSCFGVARPVVSGMNDFHGLIAPCGTQIDLQQLLRGSGLVAAEFQCVPASQHNLVQDHWQKHESHYLDLADGFAAYCKARKSVGSETVEKTLRKGRRFEREQNARFELRAPSELPLKLLLEWKNKQHAELGVVTPLQSPATQRLLEGFLRTKTERFEAFLSVLWGDDLPAGIAYILRSGPTAHCWFLGYDEQFARSSPGLLLLLKIAEALAAEGVTRLHLGKGNERFKTSLASGQVLVAEGMAGETSLALSCLEAWRLTKQWVKRSPLAIGVRMLRPLRKWWTYGEGYRPPRAADSIE